MTSIDSNPPDPRTWLVRLAQRVGHHKIAMWVWYVVGTLVTGFLVGLAGSLARVLGAMAAALGVAAGIAIMKLESIHDHHLCEACIDEVPLDPGAAAAKADRQLRVTHWSMDHRGWFRTILLGAVACVVAETLLFPHKSPARFGFIGADYALLMGFVLLLRAFNTHRRFYPWCPYCKRRGGGGGLRMPSPEPVDSTGRRR